MLIFLLLVALVAANDCKEKKNSEEEYGVYKNYEGRKPCKCRKYEREGRQYERGYEHGYGYNERRHYRPEAEVYATRPKVIRFGPYLRPERKLTIIEKHKPQYNIQTKVAAPVYILPKHGPVYSQRSRPVIRRGPIIVTPPKVVVKPTRVFVRPPPVYVNPAPVYVKPRRVIVKPTPIYYRPAPIYINPKPTYITPGVVNVKPEGIHVKPEEIVVKPRPTYIRPRRIYVRPRPVYVRPRPVYVNPRPIKIDYKPAYEKPYRRYRERYDAHAPTSCEN